MKDRGNRKVVNAQVQSPSMLGAVTEPTSIALVGAGLLGLAVARRRRVTRAIARG